MQEGGIWYDAYCKQKKGRYNMAALLEVKNLKKYFPVKKGFFEKTIGYYKAVDGLSISINAGETFGLVGESGCGKTTFGKSILRLIEPTKGEILLDGKNISSMDRRGLLHERKNMQIIFQDPYGSLHPRMTIEDIIAEPIKKHEIAKGTECSKRVAKILSTVGLSQKELRKYPYEFSGGQRQRVAIARALSVNPKLIICDEPVSALDVSIQAQILNLMVELQREFKIAYLFIAHGMPVIRHVSKNVGVMYLGKMIEMADSDTLFSHCLHPYTKALLSSIPEPDPDIVKHRIILYGEVPNLMNPPVGCLFSNRCQYCFARCLEEEPKLKEVELGHFIACHLNDYELVR